MLPSEEGSGKDALMVNRKLRLSIVADRLRRKLNRDQALPGIPSESVQVHDLR